MGLSSEETAIRSSSLGTSKGPLGREMRLDPLRFYIWILKGISARLEDPFALTSLFSLFLTPIDRVSMVFHHCSHYF
ncbi:hypothetical protein THAOC_19879 [Thalassiosira oceanica]|uniref:Uncharacterized protein n=1 Tax=Thalassiosira oceanica TaxID=159749 RepID=K0S4S2_THAOC|nr:hypothetical protein THAOC_19879 [Thalassiosira oceanica]|eukprot:EJK59844.1 hypothetical protein THAOC_19879 [Thalassiosira oceanica]